MSRRRRLLTQGGSHRGPKFTLLLLFLFSIGCASTGANPSAQLDQALIEELSQMVQADQAAIMEAMASDDPAATDRKEALIAANTTRAQALFDQYGFLGFDLVGKEGSGDFWLLVQHADDHPEFQRRVLAEMKPELDRGNADPLNYAYLWDRVHSNSGEPQRFGTQVKYTETGQAVPARLESRKDVNRYRAEIGLEPVEVYLNEMTSMHFEMNKEQMLSLGVTAPKLYSPGHSEQFEFDEPAH